MTDDEALLKVVAILARAGISTSVRFCGDAFVAYFDDGFYKSDGCAHLRHEGGNLYLHARYGEKTEVLGIEDIIQCSKEWHEFSKDRFDGWRIPPAHWAALYATLGPNGEGKGRDDGLPPARTS